MMLLLKYCGNHSLADLKCSLASKADYIGVVFAESKRQVTANELNEWLQEVTFPKQKKLVGLFVNETIEEIKRVTELTPINIVQCHGNEPVEYIKQLSESLSVPIWKVIHHQEQAWNVMDQYAPFVDGFVIDSKVAGAWGGTGTTFDWNHIPNYVSKGKQLNKKVFIAGGITPENVEQLLKYQPCGIDLSSGIEHDGQKSIQKMKQLEERIDQYVNRTR